MRLTDAQASSAALDGGQPFDLDPAPDNPPDTPAGVPHSHPIQEFEFAEPGPRDRNPRGLPGSILGINFDEPSGNWA